MCPSSPHRRPGATKTCRAASRAATAGPSSSLEPIQANGTSAGAAENGEPDEEVRQPPVRLRRRRAAPRRQRAPRLGDRPAGGRQGGRGDPAGRREPCDQLGGAERRPRPQPRHRVRLRERPQHHEVRQRSDERRARRRGRGELRERLVDDDQRLLRHPPAQRRHVVDRDHRARRIGGIRQHDRAHAGPDRLQRDRHRAPPAGGHQLGQRLPPRPHDRHVSARDRQRQQQRAQELPGTVPEHDVPRVDAVHRGERLGHARARGVRIRVQRPPQLERRRVHRVRMRRLVPPAARQVERLRAAERARPLLVAPRAQLGGDLVRAHLLELPVVVAEAHVSSARARAPARAGRAATAWRSPRPRSR